MQTRYTLLAIVIITLISACAKDAAKKDKFAVQGCTVGGFGAGALAYIKFHGDKDAKEKVAIASMLGCIAGTVVGYKIGERTEKYADAQAAAEKEIALNRKNTENLRQYNQSLKTNIDDYNQQIAMIKDSKMSASQKNKDLKDTKEIIAKQRDKAKSALAAVENELSVAQSQYDEFSTKTAQNQSENWEQQIVSLQLEKEILSEHVSTLNALDASI